MISKTIIETKQTVPTCLLVDNHFLLDYLAEALLKIGCKVIVVQGKNQPSQKTEKPKETIKPYQEIEFKDIEGLKTSVDYVFYLIDSEQTIKTNHQHVSDFLFNLVAKHQSIKCLFATNHTTNNNSIVLWEQWSKKHKQPLKNLKVVKLHEVYGPKMNISASTHIASLFSKISSNQICIQANPTIPIAPVFATDAAQSLIKIMFSRGNQKNPVHLVGKTHQPLINLAYLTQQVGERLGLGTLSIINQQGSVESSENQKNVLFSQQTVSLDVGITQTLKHIAAEAQKKIPQHGTGPVPSKRVVKPSPPKPKSRNNHVMRKYIGLWLAGLIGVVFLIFIAPFALSVYGATRALQAFKENNFSQANRWSERTTNSTNLSRRHLELLSQTQLFNQSYLLTTTMSVVEAINHFAQAGVALSQAATNGNSAFKEVMQAGTQDPFPYLEITTHSLSQSFYHLSLAQSLLEAVEVPAVFDNVNLRLQAIRETLPKIRGKISFTQELLDQAPSLLGKDQSKTYLILLQNNAELRPTGGFIGSFMLISFDHGKLLNLETYDVYDADGQLNGHVEPPLPIKEHLSEANWYLRDVNWDPHFPSTARQAEWFLEKELNRQVDGTISVNLYVIQNLLKILGPVNVVDYQETITADNIFERAEYHSEINYFEGSKQKKDFLKSISNVLERKLIGGEETSPAILNTLFESAVQNQLQASFKDEDVEEVFADNGFNGGLKNAQCPTTASAESCLTDYLGIIESNFGVNKANYFISRSLVHEVSLGKTVDHKVTIQLKNNASTATWPAGTYKNYLRLYTPANTQLVSVVQNDQSIAEEDIDTTTEHDKKIYGIYLEVPVSAEVSITFTYRQLPKVGEGIVTYVLLYEKQSGIDSFPFTTTIVNKLNTGLVPTPRPTRIVNDRAIYTGNFNTDQFFVVKYQQPTTL